MASKKQDVLLKLKYMGNVLSRLKVRTKRGRRPNVLILCQRKADTRAALERGSENVDAAVSNLEKYVNQLWPGKRARIKYLSDIKGEEGVGYPTGVVDYNIDLFPGKPGVERFMETHRGVYDLVLMNTCPVAFTHYGIIAELLKPRGYLSMRVFGTLNEKNKLNGTLNNDSHYTAQALQMAKRHFTRIKSPVDPTDEFFFRKRASGTLTPRPRGFGSGARGRASIRSWPASKESS